jgi:MYXO-CTERM domain-containing protein
MKLAMKGFGVLALTTVWCSMANAYAYSYGTAYVGTYLTSGSGTDVTLTFDYAMLGSGIGAYGYGSTIDNSVAWTDNFSTNGTYGLSMAFPTVGGSFDFAEEESINVFSLTNTSQSSYEFAVLNLDPSASAEAYSDGNGYGYGIGAAGLYNWSTGDNFIAQDVAFSGENIQGWDEYYFSQSVGGSSWVSYGYAYYGADSYAGGGASWGGAMYVLLAPGQTDLIATEAASYHEAYSTTPAPAAIAPFALGLLGALRRRKRA